MKFFQKVGFTGGKGSEKRGLGQKKEKPNTDKGNYHWTGANACIRTEILEERFGRRSRGGKPVALGGLAAEIIKSSS